MTARLPQKHKTPVVYPLKLNIKLSMIANIMKGSEVIYISYVTVMFCTGVIGLVYSLLVFRNVLKNSRFFIIIFIVCTAILLSTANIVQAITCLLYFNDPQYISQNAYQVVYFTLIWMLNLQTACDWMISFKYLKTSTTLYTLKY